MSSFDHPAMTTQLLRTLDALARDARGDAASPQFPPLLPRVIRLVSMQLCGSLARAATSAFNRLDGIQRFFQHLDVMHVRARQSYRERDAFAFDRRVASQVRAGAKV